MQECHDCGDKYEAITLHWSQSSCSYPKISSKDKQSVTGMMMGDAWCEGDNDTARVRIESTNKEYLEYISNTVDIFNDVSLRRTAEEMVDRLGGTVENTNPSYHLGSICCSLASHALTLANGRQTYVLCNVQITHGGRR